MDRTYLVIFCVLFAGCSSNLGYEGKVSVHAKYTISGPNNGGIEIWFNNVGDGGQNVTIIFEIIIEWSHDDSSYEIKVLFIGVGKQYANLTVEPEGRYYYNGVFEDNTINATVVTSRV